jgi:hypothetical protein
VLLDKEGKIVAAERGWAVIETIKEYCAKHLGDKTEEGEEAAEDE